MSKIVFLIIIAGLVVIVLAAINIDDVNAGQQPEFIQVSVLAEHRADYSVDEQAVPIPAVSIEIIEDAARDFQTQSSVRIITYTSLPTKEPKQGSEDNESSGSVDETKHDNGQGNGNGNANGNGNPGNNGNDGSHQDNGNGNNGNGNNNEKDKNKDKDKGNNGGGGGNDSEKGSEKEAKPEKTK